MDAAAPQYPWFTAVDCEHSKFPLIASIKKLRYPSNAYVKIKNAMGIGAARKQHKCRRVAMPDSSVVNPFGLCKEDFVDHYYANLPPETKNEDKKSWDTVAKEWDALLLHELGLIDSEGNATQELLDEYDAYAAPRKTPTFQKLTNNDYEMSEPAPWSSVAGVSQRQENLISSRRCYTNSARVPDRGYDAYLADLVGYSVEYLEGQVQYLTQNVQEATVSDNYVKALRDALDKKKDAVRFP